MFGISLTELVLILVVALVVLGPQRLPGMLRTVGLWIHKVRRMTTEVREQTGIDDLLRQEGIAGGLAEFRSILRGDPSLLMRSHQPRDHQPIATDDPYSVNDPMLDVTRERPAEGPDAYGALPDDLVDESALLVAREAQSSELASEVGGASVALAGANPSEANDHRSPQRVIPEPAHVDTHVDSATDVAAKAATDADSNDGAQA